MNSYFLEVLEKKDPSLVSKMRKLLPSALSTFVREEKARRVLELFALKNQFSWESPCSLSQEKQIEDMGEVIRLLGFMSSD